MSNSTTKYRFYTNVELLNLLSDRLGASPVIDELLVRLEYSEDAEDYVKEIEGSKEELLKDVDNAIDKAQDVFDRNMELVKELIGICPICEASTCVTVPEFDDIADCLNIRREE